MFWVYVLENPVGKYYIGQTGDLTDDCEITIEPIALMAISLERTASAPRTPDQTNEICRVDSYAIVK